MQQQAPSATELGLLITVLRQHLQCKRACASNGEQLALLDTQEMEVTQLACQPTAHAGTREFIRMVQHLSERIQALDGYREHQVVLSQNWDHQLQLFQQQMNTGHCRTQGLMQCLTVTHHELNTQFAQANTRFTENNLQIGSFVRGSVGSLEQSMNQFQQNMQQQLQTMQQQLQTHQLNLDGRIAGIAKAAFPTPGTVQAELDTQRQVVRSEVQQEAARRERAMTDKVDAMRRDMTNDLSNALDFREKTLVDRIDNRQNDHERKIAQQLKGKGKGKGKSSEEPAPAPMAPPPATTAEPQANTAVPPADNPPQHPPTAQPLRTTPLVPPPRLTPPPLPARPPVPASPNLLSPMPFFSPGPLHPPTTVPMSLPKVATDLPWSAPAPLHSLPVPAEPPIYSAAPVPTISADGFRQDKTVKVVDAYAETVSKTITLPLPDPTSVQGAKAFVKQLNRYPQALQTCIHDDSFKISVVVRCLASPQNPATVRELYSLLLSWQNSPDPERRNIAAMAHSKVCPLSAFLRGLANYLLSEASVAPQCIHDVLRTFTPAMMSAGAMDVRFQNSCRDHNVVPEAHDRLLAIVLGMKKKAEYHPALIERLAQLQTFIIANPQVRLTDADLEMYKHEIDVIRKQLPPPQEKYTPVPFNKGPPKTTQVHEVTGPETRQELCNNFIHGRPCKFNPCRFKHCEVKKKRWAEVMAEP